MLCYGYIWNRWKQDPTPHPGGLGVLLSSPWCPDENCFNWNFVNWRKFGHDLQAAWCGRILWSLLLSSLRFSVCFVHVCVWRAGGGGSGKWGGQGGFVPFFQTRTANPVIRFLPRTEYTLIGCQGVEVCWVDYCHFCTHTLLLWQWQRGDTSMGDMPWRMKCR